jgi:hypothetical protein
MCGPTEVETRTTGAAPRQARQRRAFDRRSPGPQFPGAPTLRRSIPSILDERRAAPQRNPLSRDRRAKTDRNVARSVPVQVSGHKLLVALFLH